jgi:predicted NBD/HSP70 family sugar kinase
VAEQNFQGSNINFVKLHNLRVILLSLLNEPSLSRVQLAQKTDLSNTTITNLISELMHQGIVEEGEEPGLEKGEQRPVGRPRTSIRLNLNARYVVGIHIGVGIFRVAVANLQAELLHNQQEQFDIESPADQVLRKIASLAQSVIKRSKVERSLILGVGIGASGLVDYTTGINLVAPNLGWHDIPLRDYFQNALRLPVFVDNNVRAMAIAETYFGAGRGVDSLAFVYGRVGVGAGLISRGQVFRGSISGAGEIGHTPMLLHGGEPCRCGNSGCLETLVSEPAILRWAANNARVNPRGILAQTMTRRQDLTPLERVFTAAREGDGEVRSMLEERAYYLGVAMAGLVNLFNPQLILFGGIFAQGQDIFLEPAIRTVQQMAFGGLGRRVTMQATSFGWKAGVAGAAALALMVFFYGQEQYRMLEQV